MTPCRYTIVVVDGVEVEYFHYKFSDLREFVKYSYEGNAGDLLIYRSPTTTNYRVSGTIEKPHPVKKMKDLFWFHFQRWSPFSKDQTAEEICNPKPLEMFKDWGYFIPVGKGGFNKLGT